MPAFNSERFIKKAIESVLSQTHANLELLICDDGSRDNTVEIVKRYIQKDSRVKLLSNENAKGAAGARNTCLDYAQGEYIAFLDSDDYWQEDKLSKQLHFMQENKYIFTYTNYFMFYEGFFKEVVTRKLNTFNSLTFTCDIGCLTVLLHKDAIGETRFPYIPKEDYALWLMILKKGIVAYNQCESTAFYRKQKKSLSSNKLKEIVRQYKVLRTVADLSKIDAILRVCTYIYKASIKHYIK